MAQEDKRLTRINKTRFVVAANARFRVLMEQPFREDAVRLGVLALGMPVTPPPLPASATIALVEREAA